MVIGGTALVTWFADRGMRAGERPLPPGLASPEPPDPAAFSQFPFWFARSLLQLTAILIPAYVLVLFVFGCLSGWLSGFSSLDARLGIAAVLVCAVVRTLLVIPAGGEIPVVLALTRVRHRRWHSRCPAGHATRAERAVDGMVGRALSWRVTLAMAAVVTVAGLVAGLLLWALM